MTNHNAGLFELGGSYLAKGQFGEAIAIFRRQAQLHPTKIESWTALAHCLMVSSRPSAALVAYDAALRIDPRSAAALCGKARVLQSQSQVAGAVKLFELALEESPGSPEALLGLAKLAVESGDWVMAERWTRRVSDVSHGPETVWLKARIHLGVQDYKNAEFNIRKLLTDFVLEPLQRADALLLLGLTLDNLGQFENAFQAAVDGKRVQRQFYAQRAAGREPEPQKLARLDRWFAQCDPAPWRAPAGCGDVEDPATHVFLIGFPRSGTTLLEQALAGHPEIATLEEAPTLAEPYAEFLETPAGLTRLSNLSLVETETWRSRYWSDLRRFGLQGSPRVFIDKNPGGDLYLPLIAKLFPHAKVLFALRDPRDVVLSCLKNNFQMNALTYAFTDLDSAAACYSACMAMVQTYRRVLPLQVLEVRHEVLVKNFERELDAVCQFIGVAPTAQMLDIAATTRRRLVRTPSAPQLREGLNEKGLGRWRAYKKELTSILPLLDPWVREFGYEQGS